jgi:dTDP-4-amino-4,6-dideoxygalactose transaminase
MIDFHDLRPQHAALAGTLRAAVQRVAERGWFVLGPEVEAFETAFARYHGVSHAVGVASGTDAIELALRAGGIGPGDEVLTVANTAVATVCAIERAGATPVFVDIDPYTYTMDPIAALAAITPRTRAVVPVHLYGHPADMEALRSLADRHHLLLVEDCAQACGARYHQRPVGTLGHLGAFSFYPTKNLGAWGDGGAVLTNDASLASRLRRLRNYGQETRHQHLERGINSRLDEVQAAVLSIKLAQLDAFNDERRRLAALYRVELSGMALPTEREEVQHVYQLYVVRHRNRDSLREGLRRLGVATMIHYPVPIHRQPAYASLGYAPGALPATERAASEVLSLPLYIGLKPKDIASVARALWECLTEVRHAG